MQIVQISIFVILIFLMDREQRRLSHNQEIIDKQIQEMQHFCHCASFDIMAMLIRCALIDLQLGNTTYTLVFQLIKDSNLPEEAMNGFFEMLNEVAEVYNLKKV